MPENNTNPPSPPASPERNSARSPAGGFSTGKRNELKLTKNYYKPQIETDNVPKNQAASSPDASPPGPFLRKPDSPQRLWQNILLAIGWLLFILLGGILIYFRFLANLQATALDSLKLCGMIAVGIAYLVSIAIAIKDNMFDGLLAIVVPCYPFYYLFLKSGSVVLCAITAALLFAFGFDCLLLLQNIALKAIDWISHWIQNVNN
jgi:hypothetical protein